MKQVTVKLRGQLAKALAWCAKALSTDDNRPALTGLYIKMPEAEGGIRFARVIASDGFRLHLIDVPPAELDWLGLEDGIWQPWSPIKGSAHINELTRLEIGLPGPFEGERSQEILGYLDKEPVAQVKLQARYLMDALKHLERGGQNSTASTVTIKLFGKDELVVLELWSAKDDEMALGPRTAIIMPMYWRS